MSIGVNMSEKDLSAIKRLYEVRWSGDIRNWKEPDTDYCLWFVSCPDYMGRKISEVGKSLETVIDKLLTRALDEYVEPYPLDCCVEAFDDSEPYSHRHTLKNYKQR